MDPITTRPNKGRDSLPTPGEDRALRRLEAGMSRLEAAVVVLEAAILDWIERERARATA